MAMRDLIPWGRQPTSAPALWRENEWSPIASLRREMDRLFDDMFRAPTFGSFGTGFGTLTNWPSLDVKESDHEVTVTAEVPGMNDKDVELLLDNGMLTIRGEKKGEKDERGYSERWYGRFERQVPFPSSVDEDNAKAEFHDGLLTVTLRKVEGAENRKRIPINAETRH
jgi:HSP20 family protein